MDCAFLRLQLIQPHYQIDNVHSSGVLAYHFAIFCVVIKFVCGYKQKGRSQCVIFRTEAEGTSKLL